MLSDYFDVTTDYLLKGIEPIADESKKEADARIFSIVGTALNFIGLVTAIMVWKEEQTAKNFEFSKWISETSESTINTEPTTPPEGDELVMLPEYAELYEQNNDMVGWICIEDTKINYPVMQSVDEPNFYLKHGFDKGYTDYGCPYVGESCDVNKPSDNLIIYGHHMKNGSMFSDLEKFKKKDFWEEHKAFSFNTLYEKQTYEVIAVFKTVVYTDSASEFRYYQLLNL